VVPEVTYSVRVNAVGTWRVYWSQANSWYGRRLDFDLIDEVRQQWAFYRDRRPDAYEGLVRP
ncbi:hypothetical protein ACWDRM_32285, partial [Streptomyces cellulosae]